MGYCRDYFIPVLIIWESFSTFVKICIFVPSAGSEFWIRTVTPLGTLTIILPKWGLQTLWKKTNISLHIWQSSSFIPKECSVAAMKSSTRTTAFGKTSVIPDLLGNLKYWKPWKRTYYQYLHYVQHSLAVRKMKSLKLVRLASSFMLQ